MRRARVKFMTPVSNKNKNVRENHDVRTFGTLQIFRRQQDTEGSVRRLQYTNLRNLANPLKSTRR